MDLMDIESRTLRLASSLGALAQLAASGGRRQQLDLTTDNLAGLFDLLEQEAVALAGMIEQHATMVRAART